MQIDDKIREHVKGKKDSYRKYDFSNVENEAFKTFFDLAQEFDGHQDFCNLCVCIPHEFFNQHARLYLLGEERMSYDLMAASEHTADGPPESYPIEQPPETCIRTSYNTLLIKIRGNAEHIKQLPFKVQEDVIGLFEVYPASDIGSNREFYLEKYANRIGYNLHNRVLAQKNVEHLKFINSLVADIEHNVIAPNIVYSLYIKKLENAVEKSVVLQAHIEELASAEGSSEELLQSIEQFDAINHNLKSEVQDIKKHHRNMSLFLETLFRRSHFDLGRLTLKKKRCNMRTEVVAYQIERYRNNFQNLGIALDEDTSGVPEEIITVVDVGLISQVYANLFSNATKYTEQVDTDAGPRKYVSYGYEMIKDLFGTGRDGLKYNVFSTGPHVSEHERHRLFDDKFRGQNVQSKPGTGHGLAFIKNVVEIHGGSVGYEPTHLGNSFYFILPR